MQRENHSSMQQRMMLLVNGQFASIASLIWNYICNAKVMGRSADKGTILLWKDEADITKEYYENCGEDYKLEQFNSSYKSAVYRIDEHTTVNVKPASSWLSYNKNDSFQAAYKGWINFMADYKEKLGLPLLSSPSLTGLYTLEHLLPREKTYKQLPREVETIIRDNTTQARIEFLAHDKGKEKEISQFYYYDGRLMYLAFCDRELPCGLPVHDYKPIFQQFVPGWYRVQFTIPEHWAQIGLLPVKNEHGWWWPDYRYAGETFETWCTEVELRHAFKHNWQFEVQERIIFDQTENRPLRTWKEKLLAFRPQTDGKFAMHLKRRIILESIGAMYTSTHRREFSCTFEEWPTIAERLSQDEQLGARMGQGRIFYTRQVHKTDEQAKFYMPHWSAYIWAYARVRLAHEMLKVKRSDLLGCYLDAIYTKAAQEHLFPENHEVAPGNFRLKGWILKKQAYPQTMNDLHKLAQVAARGDLREQVEFKNFRVKEGR